MCLVPKLFLVGDGYCPVLRGAVAGFDLKFDGSSSLDYTAAA